MIYITYLCIYENPLLLRNSGVEALSGYQILTGLKVICA